MSLWQTLNNSELIKTENYYAVCQYINKKSYIIWL